MRREALQIMRCYLNSTKRTQEARKYHLNLICEQADLARAAERKNLQKNVSTAIGNIFFTKKILSILVITT